MVPPSRIELLLVRYDGTVIPLDQRGKPRPLYVETYGQPRPTGRTRTSNHQGIWCLLQDSNL
jgi:hypothetical protein